MRGEGAGPLPVGDLSPQANPLSQRKRCQLSQREGLRNTRLSRIRMDSRNSYVSRKGAAHSSSDLPQRERPHPSSFGFLLPQSSRKRDASSLGEGAFTRMAACAALIESLSFYLLHNGEGKKRGARISLLSCSAWLAKGIPLPFKKNKRKSLHRLVIPPHDML